MATRIIPLAARKIKKRRISTSMLTKTIKHPDQIVEGYGGRIIYQKIYIVEDKKKLLRIVCDKVGNNNIVVTSYLTSQIKKYWRT